jgi:hypothetical protein
MNSEVDAHAYVQDLEKHLQLTLFGGRIADPEGAVLLVRGALAEGDSERAANLADATRRLAATTPDHPNMAAAADHARGLIHRTARCWSRWSAATTARARATALEDAAPRPGLPGQPGQRGGPARQAYALYEDSARPRARPGSEPAARAGHPAVPLDPWTVAFGWDGMWTDETLLDRLAAAEGLSNRQVASRVFLSTHTVAFHLRHVFWKLGVTSRVQLARMAAEQAATG